jgi:hypothetical protein
MNRVLTLFSLIAITSCSPRFVEKTISHDYSNVTFSPDQEKELLPNGLSISITPIDAKQLDAETFGKASRDGNYEKEFASEVRRAVEENGSLRRSDKDKTVELKAKAIDAIDDLVQRGEMQAEVGSLLKLRIWRGESFGQDGSDIKSLSNISNAPSLFNPFFLNGRYLSLFKATFENTSNEIVRIGVDDFQVSLGEELLKPYKPSFFEKAYEEVTEKLKSAYRFSMPEELTITPSQTVTKYLAIPSIDRSNEAVTVQYLDGDTFKNFSFALKSERSSISYKLESYTLDAYGFNKGSSEFFVVQIEGGPTLVLEDNTVFIEKNRKDAEVTVFAFTVANVSEEFAFGKKSGIDLRAVKGHKIQVEVDELE